MKNIAIILSGCGNMDGSEIHESVFSMLAIAEAGCKYQCFAPDIKQHHVINHITKQESEQNRNVLEESSRIARGEIKGLNHLKASEYDALVIPGGAGAAKNLTSWAFDGHKSVIIDDLRDVIISFVKQNKPIVALCISPVVIARALEGTKFNPTITIGTNKESSPYDIDGIKDEVELCGSKVAMKSIEQVSIDKELKIITAPCYMMDADIEQVRNNAKMAIDQMINMI